MKFFWLLIQHVSIYFQRLRNEASLTHNYSIKSSKLLENKNRNRYRDVSPCEYLNIAMMLFLDLLSLKTLCEVNAKNRQFALPG